MPPIHAVLTADIVRSTSMTPAALQSLSDRLRNFPDPASGQLLYFYRGDSFQLFLKDPRQAFRTALMLRTEARHSAGDDPEDRTDLRISIGIGGTESPLTELNTARGEAFLLSGRGLDALGKTDRRMTMATGSRLVNTALAAISLFTDHLFERLTGKQAEVLQHLLRQRTQLETADILGRSQSTINRHLRSLGWRDLEQLLQLYDEIMDQMPEIHG